MGTLIGHVIPGIGFFIIGLWHLINNIKLHSLNPKSYISLPFFPTSKSKYLELYFMMGCSSFYILLELVFGQIGHHLFDSDGAIRSNHLRNFEHAFITLWMLVYSVFAKILDKHGRPKSKYGLTMTLAVVMFCQEFLLYHLHSTDHMGLEGHYHWFLQIVIFVSIVTTILSIGYRNSFLISFVRSFSILFQGVWDIVMGIMLWTPSVIPKDCFMIKEEYFRVRCHTKEALDRAKALTTLEFSWYLVVFVVLTMFLYMYMTKLYPEKAGFEPFVKYDREHEKIEDNVDTKKKSVKSDLLDTLIEA
ncbi:transmembrane protein 45A-like [Impatiens glandulifera]|uniref:transmembrane protein 45A-like n=1 Tax=Impatiens glandulifera TaxID=253017 RepID=UPI001FB05736|nr:transmembrane protein 45A-like [Impatiens glandulifera]